MKTNYILSAIIVVVAMNLGVCQNFKLGQVSLDELNLTQDSTFKDAAALILERNVSVKVSEYIEVYEKIKILNENGLDYATITFPYPNVYKINGYTYNLEDGEITKSEITNDMIFTEKIIGKEITLKKRKASFPKVKVGSVLEIYYKSTKGTFADIPMQDYIPIKNFSVTIKNKSSTSFRFVQNPMAYLDVKSHNTKNKIMYSAENIPPLEPENFVFDMELFRAKIIPRATGYFRSSLKIDKWSDIPKAYLGLKQFENQLNPIFKSEIANLIKGESDPLKRVELVYKFIHNNFSWDGGSGTIPETDNDHTFSQKTGSIPDLNMLFVALLRTAGVEVYPILASTKMNGMHKYASLEAFDYTLVGVKIHDEWHVYDVAYPEATFEFIPVFMVNWKGMIVKDNGKFEWIDLTKPKMSTKKILVSGSFDNNFVFSGKVRERLTGFFEQQMRHKVKNSKIEKDSLTSSVDEGLKLENISIEINESNSNANISYEFISEDEIEEVGDEFHFSPLAFLATQENPFKKEVRKYPIDFIYPFAKEYVFSIKIPEGFNVTYMPDPIKVSMPDDMGSYYYKVENNDMTLTVLMKFKMNVASIEVDQYQALKEFYKVIVAKEIQKVVFKQI